MARTLIPKSFKANIDRALHNLYQEKQTTLHPLTAVPIYYKRMLKGDVMNFGVLESILRSEPTFAPLLANWRLRFEWYFDSDANRYGWIDNNTRLTPEEVMNRKHHTYRCDFAVDVDGSNATGVGIGRGSVADYAGIAPGYVVRYSSLDKASGNPEANIYGIDYNIDFHLTYLNIIRNYHVNNQFTTIPYIKDSTSINDALAFDIFPRHRMDELFMFLRSCPNGVHFLPCYDPDGENVSMSDYCDAPYRLVDHYSAALKWFHKWLNSTSLQYSGLFCTQFEPDLYQNLLGDMNLLRSTVTTNYDADGNQQFTIEQFRLKNHLQLLYDKIFVSGGADRDLSRTLWGIESNRDYDIPELICVHSEIIGTNMVESSTAGEVSLPGIVDPVKNVAGSMSGNINSRRGAGRIQKFTAKTSGSLMCIVSLTPLVTYSQNVERHLFEYNFMDEFTPDMARKGFESVPLSDYYALPVLDEDGYVNVNWYNDWSIDSEVGKQIAWLREMTAVNRCHGEFSNGGDKEAWVLKRDYLTKDYDSDGNITTSISVSPYGNPLDFQYPFVAQTLLDPNFYLQVAIKNDAYRPIPRRFMPNLGN